MSVRQSLLAILDQGPCYGYQLRTEFDRRTGSTWPLNVGQIYNTLDRLERDGLVDKIEHESPDVDNSGQIYYRITEAGSTEVRGWLDSPVDRAAAMRDELAMKLAMAVTLPGVDIANLFLVQRTATLRRVQELTTSKEATGDPESAEELARSLIVDSMVFQAEAEMRWLDRSEEKLNRASAMGYVASLPLSTEAPKRGRPAKAAAR